MVVVSPVAAVSLIPLPVVVGAPLLPVPALVEDVVPASVIVAGWVVVTRVSPSSRDLSGPHADDWRARVARRARAGQVMRMRSMEALAAGICKARLWRVHVWAAGIWSCGGSAAALDGELPAQY